VTHRVAPACVGVRADGSVERAPDLEAVRSSTRCLAFLDSDPHSN
jgi:hypothetical protein